MCEEEWRRCGAEVARRAETLSREKMYLVEFVVVCVIEFRVLLGDEMFVGVVEDVGEGLEWWLSGDCGGDVGADTFWLACEMFEVLLCEMCDRV